MTVANCPLGSAEELSAIAEDEALLRPMIPAADRRWTAVRRAVVPVRPELGLEMGAVISVTGDDRLTGWRGVVGGWLHLHFGTGRLGLARGHGKLGAVGGREYGQQAQGDDRKQQARHGNFLVRWGRKSAAAYHGHRKVPGITSPVSGGSFALSGTIGPVGP